MFQSKLEELAVSFLKEIGEQIDRAGVLETPARFAKAQEVLFSGYGKTDADLDKLFKVFDSDNDSMIVQTGIPVYSFCEHHILPFFGTCNIGYVPDKKVIGASKLTRIVNHFSRRLQIQEQLTEQIGQTIFDKLGCKGVMVTMSCIHLCMAYRGVEEKPTLITSKILGIFREKDAARAEFLSLSGGTPKLLLGE